MRRKVAGIRSTEKLPCAAESTIGNTISTRSATGTGSCVNASGRRRPGNAISQNRPASVARRVRFSGLSPVMPSSWCGMRVDAESGTRIERRMSPRRGLCKMAANASSPANTTVASSPSCATTSPRPIAHAAIHPVIHNLRAESWPRTPARAGVIDPLIRVRSASDDFRLYLARRTLRGSYLLSRDKRPRRVLGHPAADERVPAMRLMFVASALDCGGAERHTLELASALSARGHSCDLVAMQPARDDSWVRSLIDSRPDNLPLRLVTLDARHQFDGHAARRLSAELRQRQPQVVMAVNGYPLIHAARAVRAAGFAAAQRPALALAFHSTRLAGAKELLQHGFVTPIARGCDQLVFVSEFQSRHWLRRGLRARRNAVIHNAVADKRFAPSVRTQWRAATRATLGLGDADYVLGCCAQLRPEKNHAQLIDAVIALRREGIAAHALIVGEGPQRPVIERYAQARSASPWVSLVGHQNQVEQYIAAFDVGVLCSVAHETFSLAALEQKSMGVPVVLSDQGGAREMVNDGVHGFVVPTGDTPALVDALRRLHPLDARARMGAQAAEQVASRFRHAHMVDRYEALFESLADGAARPTASARPSGPVAGPERSAARIREHYLVERQLAARLKEASKEERKSLYTQAYDELFRRIPDHPQISIKVSPESSRLDVRRQLAFIGRFLRPGQTFLEIG